MTRIEIRKMRPEEMENAVGILARWNMAPIPPSAEHPEPERSGLEPDRTFVALAEGRIVGLASYLLLDDAWAEMKAIGVRHVRTETDRPETIAWYTRKFGYRVTGTNPKKHSFSLEHVDYWTVLTLDLQDWGGPS